MAANPDKQCGNFGGSESVYLGGRYAEILEFLCAECTGTANVKVLVSEPGLGKTFVVHAALARMQSVARTAFLFWTLLRPDEFVRYLLLSVGSVEMTAEMGRAQRHFERVLEDAAHHGKRFVLAIDEAQNLCPSLLDTLAGVIDSGLARTGQLQIILSALPAFRTTLTTPGASKLHGRLAGLMSIPPLTCEQAAEYIQHRFSRVRRAIALPPLVLPQEVVASIRAKSNGIPRIIDRFCDRILYEIVQGGREQINGAMLNRALTTEGLAAFSTLVTSCQGRVAGLDTKSEGCIEARTQLTASADQLCAGAPESAPESISVPCSRIERIGKWFCSHPGEWSGTAAELAFASGTSDHGLTELLRDAADALRSFGIAVHIERCPGRPRIVRLCHL